MGYTLVDRETDVSLFSVNFWHWGAIAAAAEATGLTPEAADGAVAWDQPYCHGNGLDRAACRRIAEVLRCQLLPRLQAGQRLLADGSVTTEPDSGQLFRDRENWWRNYGTSAAVLEEFITVLEICNGFKIY